MIPKASSLSTDTLPTGHLTTFSKPKNNPKLIPLTAGFVIKKLENFGFFVSEILAPCYFLTI